jgi:hypothetical protein
MRAVDDDGVDLRSHELDNLPHLDFLPNAFHQRRLRRPVGRVRVGFSKLMWACRFGTKAYSPRWKRSEEAVTLRTSRACMEGG